MSGTTTLTEATPDDAPAAPAYIERGRALVEPALREAVARLDERTGLVTSYHFGWCDAEGRAVTTHGGKAIRPVLTLLAATAEGAEEETAMPGAVAVELVHNFSLVHDDLMDRDAERRHQPTVWAVWGDATAVLAGDAMLSLAHEVLESSTSPYALRASRALTLSTRELIRGQVLDMAFEDRSPISAPVALAECLDMAGGKTGSLLGVSAEIGALLAGASDSTAAAYRTYGYEMGLAFQLVDDLLGIWGWPERTGKPVFSDLQARKKTLPVVWAIEHGGAVGRQLAQWLVTPGPRGDREEDDLRYAADLIERAGGREWAGEEAERRAVAALAALEPLDLSPDHRAQFDELARFVVEREL